MRSFKNVIANNFWKIVIAFCLLPLLLIPNTYGAFTGRITNNTNTAQSAIIPIITNCRTAVNAANAYLAYPFDDVGPPVALDATPNIRNGAYSLQGVRYRRSGPCPQDGAFSVGLDGISGLAYGPNQTINPQTLTMQIWFRVTNNRSGKLIGLGNSRTGTSTQYDRHLYINNTGRLVWGVNPGQIKTVVSPQQVDDNQWHQAVGTLAPAGSTNPGLRLYVDGQLVASDPTTVAAENFAGFVRIGYDNLAGWPNTNLNSFYLDGQVAWGSVYLTALTPAQILAMYNIGI